MNTTQQTIRTTITLPLELHGQLRIAAIKQKRSFNDVVLEKLGGSKSWRKLSIKQQLKRDFALFNKIAASSEPIDAVKAIREERDSGHHEDRY